MALTTPSRSTAVPTLLAALVVGVCCAAGFGATPAVADDVHLTNGEVFEGVVAQRHGGEVRIRLEIGEITLPGHRVAKIVQADSALAEYMTRRAALGGDAGAAGAVAWVELAGWADAQGLVQATREAALTAARLDPAAPGLPRLLAPLGYGRDDTTGRWLPEAELMARRGYVRDGDVWIPREVAVARAQEAAAERRAVAEERRAQRADRLEEAVTLLALSRLAEAAEDDDEPAAGPWTPYAPYGFGIGTGGTVVVTGPVYRGGHGGSGGGEAHHPPDRHHPRTEPPRSHRGSRSAVGGYDDLIGRQPGSLIPVSEDRSGSSRRPDRP